jgi:hypothetical protein
VHSHTCLVCVESNSNAQTKNFLNFVTFYIISILLLVHYYVFIIAIIHLNSDSEYIFCRIKSLFAKERRTVKVENLSSLDLATNAILFQKLKSHKMISIAVC